MHRYGHLVDNHANMRSISSSTLDKAAVRFTGVLNANNNNTAYSAQHRLLKSRRARKNGVVTAIGQRMDPGSMRDMRAETKRRQMQREKRRRQAVLEEEGRREKILRKRRLRMMENTKAIRSRASVRPTPINSLCSAPSKSSCDQNNMFDAKMSAGSEQRRCGSPSLSSGHRKAIADRPNSPLPAASAVAEASTRRAAFRRLALEASVLPQGNTTKNSMKEQPELEISRTTNQTKILSTLCSSNRFSNSIPTELSDESSSVLLGPAFNALSGHIDYALEQVEKEQLSFNDDILRDSINTFMQTKKDLSKEKTQTPVTLAGRHALRQQPIRAVPLPTLTASGQVHDSAFFNPNKSQAKFHEKPVFHEPIRSIPASIAALKAREARKGEPSTSLPPIHGSVKSDFTASRMLHQSRPSSRRRRRLPHVLTPPGFSTDVASVFSEPVRESPTKSRYTEQRKERELQDRLASLNEKLRSMKVESNSLRQHSRQEYEPCAPTYGSALTMAPGEIQKEKTFSSDNKSSVALAPLPWRQCQPIYTTKTNYDKKGSVVVLEGNASEGLPRIRISSKPDYEASVLSHTSKLSVAARHQPLMPKRAHGKAEFATRTRRRFTR